MQPPASGGSYVTALRVPLLTRLYDPIVRLTTREGETKRRLLARAALEPGMSVLDLACGTGTLSLRATDAHADLQPVGIDGDAQVLALAARKVGRVGARVSLVRGLAQKLPFRTGSFDRVLSSLFFHHLEAPAKEAAMSELTRVLRPGGQVHIADWGRPSSLLMRALFLPVQALDGWRNTQENLEGALLRLIDRPELESIGSDTALPTPLGTIRFHSARRV